MVVEICSRGDRPVDTLNTILHCHTEASRSENGRAYVGMHAQTEGQLRNITPPSI